MDEFPESSINALSQLDCITMSAPLDSGGFSW